MADIPLRVVLDEKHNPDDPKTKSALEEAGLKIEQQIPEIGVVYGTADQGKLSKLRGVQGVLEVEAEGRIDLPPMSGDIPQ